MIASLLLLVSVLTSDIHQSMPYEQETTVAAVSVELEALSDATEMIGKPYVWAGTSPEVGFDCSGLTQWAYAEQGVSIPRTTYGQFYELHRIDAPEVGGLVFFSGASHVGIVAHDGNFIHAENYGKGVTVDRLDDPYWAARITGYAIVD